MVCIQNHDQVGNRAFGERITTLAGFPKSRLAAALLLLSPYVPLLFMGEEYGETNPFQYFVSHGDAKLVEAVRNGRRKEFEQFGWGDDLPDPQAVETFERSRPDRRRSSGEHAGMRALYRDLLRLRRNERSLRPGDAEARVACDEADEWISQELASDRGRPVMALFNLSDSARCIPAATSMPGTWTLVLSTADATYGGEGGAPARLPDGGGATARVPVPAASASVYVRESDR
jgi:maltooligosyltrehalose trehalohydrolase